MFRTPYSFNKPSCPINFEDRTYGGNIPEVEEFTNIDLGSVRSVILNGKVYFSSVDLCRGLLIPQKHSAQITNEAINALLRYKESKKVDHPLSVGVPYKQNKMLGSLTVTPPYNSSFDPNELAYMVTIPIVRKVNQYSDEVRTFYTPTLFVSEPVLYMLTFRSRKAEAEMFKAWLAMDVLPYLNILGRDKSMATIVNEVNRHVDQVANNLIANQNVMINEQRCNNDYTNYNINDLRGRIDSIGNISAKSNHDEEIIDKKIDGIVGGLAAILGM